MAPACESPFQPPGRHRNANSLTGLPAHLRTAREKLPPVQRRPEVSGDGALVVCSDGRRWSDSAMCVDEYFKEALIK